MVAITLLVKLMALRKYDYEKYLNQSKKLNKFLNTLKNRKSTYRAYRLHLVRYFEYMKIKDVDHYVKDTRTLNKKEKIQYLDNLEKDLTEYWQIINQQAHGKTPYLWLTAIKMFLIHNKTFELDDVFIKLQKNGHGNYSITNTKTPTKEQLLRIFSYSNPESKALFMFQLTSGQRIEQVIETIFQNIDMKHDCPRIFYPHTKQKYVVKTRITPETKQLLQEYLDQRDKFIKTRIDRGKHRRKKELDMNKVFPMDTGTANAIWTTMVKNAGLYELDPNTHKPVFGTHCLRRYFLTHFGDKEFGDFFSGHITPRNKEYRQYSDEQLDEEYMKHKDEITVFETNPDLTETHKEIDQLKKENQELLKWKNNMEKQLNLSDMETLKKLIDLYSSKLEQKLKQI